MKHLFTLSLHSRNLLDALNTGPVKEAIREQASVVIQKMFAVGYYVDILRKVLTIISIVMLIGDAVRYLRSYYTDSSFDNMYIGSTTRRFAITHTYKFQQ